MPESCRSLDICDVCGVRVETGRETDVNAEEFSRREMELAGWPIAIETYKLDGVYHCTISNIDPGARFARADGPTREDAERRALEKAERYLAQTRRFPTT